MSMAATLPLADAAAPMAVSSAETLAAASTKDSVLHATYLRIKGTSGTLAQRALAWVKYWGGRLTAFLPTALTSLLGPVVMATKWGYNIAMKAVELPVRGIWKLVRWVGRLFSKAISVAIEWVAKGVGIFSESGATKVREFGTRAATWRAQHGAVLSAMVSHAGDRVLAAADSKTARYATALTAGAVAGTIATAQFAPATFAGAMASMSPAAATAVTGVATGGFLAAMAPIAAVAGIAILIKLAFSVFRKPKAVTAPAEVELIPILEGEIVTVPAPYEKVVTENGDVTVREDGSLLVDITGKGQVEVTPAMVEEMIANDLAEAEHDFRPGKKNPHAPKGQRGK